MNSSKFLVIAYGALLFGGLLQSIILISVLSVLRRTCVLLSSIENRLRQEIKVQR